MVTCNWPHYVTELYGVPILPIRELPHTCPCGEPIMYDPDLVFFSAPGFSEFEPEGIVEVTELTYGNRLARIQEDAAEATWNDEG